MGRITPAAGGAIMSDAPASIHCSLCLTRYTSRPMIQPAPQTSALLSTIAESDAGPSFTLDELLETFKLRAFGVMLLAVVLPALLPIPFGIGALVGPLVSALGLQLILRLDNPWMPRVIRHRPFSRDTLHRFLVRMTPWMHRLERISKPRIEILFAGVLGNLVTGVLLVALGIMLASPIPLTNYPFGLLILGYAFALIERDGALLLLVWLVSVLLIGSFAGVAAEALAWFWQALG